ncbi:hypothetical protein WN943_003242 [Citrus x changshan-huyou]
MQEVFETLKCTQEGLSTEAAEQRLSIFGSNKLEEKRENNAGAASAALMARLAPKSKVLRDGNWKEEDAANLVPGDVISVKLGDIIPADARLLEGDPLAIDQSALTGESLTVSKGPGDCVYSGSTCKQGEIQAVVIATGVRTFLGRAVHLVDTTNQVGHFQKILSAVGEYCICSIALGLIAEIIVMYAIQHREYRTGLKNLLVLLIGGIPIAMPTVLSVTMAIGSQRLSLKGVITKRMSAIVDMAGMDVLCCDKTGTLTLNKLTVDKNLIEIFARGVDVDTVVLMAARASQVENLDVIDAAIVGTLADPMEDNLKNIFFFFRLINSLTLISLLLTINKARADIQEVHFLPFDPTGKRTALMYIDSEGKMHRVTKGAPEQILNLLHNKSEIGHRVNAVINKFAERGLRSLAVAYQEVPEGSKESSGSPWQFIGLIPLFDPPIHDSAETIRRALSLGLSVKMITGDQLAIAKETGRRLGMGTNMYPSSALLGQDRDESIVALPVDELIEKADGFAGVFPEHKYEIVKRLQARKHICGMIGNGINDAPALKKADIGIAVADAIDAARSAADIVLTEPGLNVIITAVLNSRAIFQRMKNYTVRVGSDSKEKIYAVSDTIHIGFAFRLLALIWQFNFPPFMVLIIAILNDGAIIITISKDRVRPSPHPERWNLTEIFVTGSILGGYLAMMTVIFFWTAYKTDFFPLAPDGLPQCDTTMFSAQSSYGELSRIAEEAKRRAEIARLRELHTLKGHVESLIRLKGLDIKPIPQSYSV